MTKPNLRAVAALPDQPAPSYAYEAEQRRMIASIDWARVHVRGDRAAPLTIIDKVRRTWR